MVLIIVVVVSCVYTSHSAWGQTEKTLQRADVQAQSVQSPYITYSEFKNISIDGQGSMRELLTVRSVDQAVHILGKPKERDIVEITSGGYKESTTLVYEGLKITYLEAAGDVHLEQVEVTSADHFLQIGDRKVHPGMSQSKLSSPLQKELSQAKAGEKKDGMHTTILTDQKGGKESKRGNRILEHTEIRIEMDEESGEVRSVVFSRVV